MMQRDSGQWVLLGTVSHGIKCAEPNLPGVYMRTSAYRRWIDNVIKKSNLRRTSSKHAELNRKQSEGTTSPATSTFVPHNRKAKLNLWTMRRKNEFS